MVNIGNIQLQGFFTSYTVIGRNLIPNHNPHTHILQSVTLTQPTTTCSSIIKVG